MSTLWFPDLPGFGWKRTRSTKFNTLTQTSASGLEARIALQTLAKREWELPFNYLREGSPWFDVETLEGFYILLLGSLNTCFFRDQYQNQSTAQFIATGDGVSSNFQLQRTIQGVDEPVFCVDTRTSATYGPYTRPAALVPVVFINSVAIATVVNATPATGGASVNTENGQLTLGASATTSSSGHSITATFSYGFRVRFEDDTLELDNHFGAWNEMQSLKLIQTRV